MKHFVPDGTKPQPSINFSTHIKSLTEFSFSYCAQKIMWGLARMPWARNDEYAQPQMPDAQL
jgi:hypothetical protein